MRRKQANASIVDLANNKENLKPTNESLNKAKGANSNKDIVDNRDKFEDKWSKRHDKEIEKIEKSNEAPGRT